jgi:hypothetical protein
MRPTPCTGSFRESTGIVINSRDAQGSATLINDHSKQNVLHGCDSSFD